MFALVRAAHVLPSQCLFVTLLLPCLISTSLSSFSRARSSTGCLSPGSVIPNAFWCLRFGHRWLELWWAGFNLQASPARLSLFWPLFCSFPLLAWHWGGDSWKVFVKALSSLLKIIPAVTSILLVVPGVLAPSWITPIVIFAYDHFSKSLLPKSCNIATNDWWLFQLSCWVIFPIRHLQHLLLFYSCFMVCFLYFLIVKGSLVTSLKLSKF